MQKRGQVYLLAAFVLVSVLYSLTLETNRAHTFLQDRDFAELARNYEVEGAHFVNDLLQQEQPVADAFVNFTATFTSYAKTKNQAFGLIYAFIFNDRLYLGNYLDDELNLISPVSVSIPGCGSEVPASLSVAGLSLVLPLAIAQKGCIVGNLYPPPNFVLEFKIGETSYRTVLAPNNPELMIVARAQKDGNVLVYSRGTFL